MRRKCNFAHLILAGVVFLGLTPLIVCVDVQAQITFVSDRDGNPEIYVMEVDGNNARNLTNNPDKDFQPSWSPDSNRIAFSSDRRGDFENFDIYVMDVDGGNQQKLTNNRGDDSAPSWSPDSNRIAFYSRRDGNAEIYVMDVDGGNPQNLTNNPHADASPAWLNSPFSVSLFGKKITIWGQLKQVDR